MKNTVFLTVLAAMLGCLMASHSAAQSFKLLHSFTEVFNDAGYPNADGTLPQDRLVLSGTALYGTAQGGGGYGNGNVFAINGDGTGFRTLHNFTGPWDSANLDGAFPNGLVLSDSTLYGTAQYGGSSNFGSVFAIKTDGTGFTNLHSFAGFPSEGTLPIGRLVLSGNTLYGTTKLGGSIGGGTVFAINTDGTGFTTLYNFTILDSTVVPYTNSGGAHPAGRLVLLGDTLFGTTPEGGGSGMGTLFAIRTDGTGFSVVYTFSPLSNGWSGTNSDGAYPYTGLIVSRNVLYGTTQQGGSYGNGTVFSLNADGTSFTTLYSFTGAPNGTNTDGAYPSSLVLSGSTLYSTAGGGGAYGSGTVFALNTNGAALKVIHNFAPVTGQTVPGNANINSDGIGSSGPNLLDNVLYGLAIDGGRGGSGTIFSISLPAPQLVVSQSGADVLLGWPTTFAGFDYSGYTLQSATNLV